MTHVHADQPPTVFPKVATSFALPGPAGPLEVACDMPTMASVRAGTAVICHPHPQQGGTMHNKVVTIIERALREIGLFTVRFNFRGVGESAGSYDEGRGEGDDLAAVVDWVRRVQPADGVVWLAGFSFGSYVALANARRLAAAALITVAPPVGRWPFEGIELPDCPWLAVQGEDDEVVDPQAVFAWIESLANPPTLVRMPETGHFFHRRLMDLRGAIKNAVRGYLPPPIGAS
ncbi:MAG TPA: CocE/NonD family hydrolase [Rhodanobacteraceae bacterium]|nr:CocE/NonD family hydrolase [Rhodanobacteraceae bacterium]